jgi:hypothetical protein
MKAWQIKYSVNDNEFSEVVVSDKLRSAKYKLAMKHKCDIKRIKIIDSNVFLDNTKEE